MLWQELGEGMGWEERARLLKRAESGVGGAGERTTGSERCGLCGKRTKPLRRTECCGRLICDDYGDYAMFSYARNSCSRNHDRFTLCGSHHTEGHRGDWKTCRRCRKDFETEMYVYYGTNEYNFEKLLNPPKYEPTHCAGCGRVIVLSRESYTRHPDGSCRCAACFED